MYSYPIFSAGLEVERIYPEDIRSCQIYSLHMHLYTDIERQSGYYVTNDANVYDYKKTGHKQTYDRIGQMDMQAYRDMRTLLEV